MKQKEINKVEIRNLQKEDYDQLASSFTRVYADGSDVFWTPEQIDKLIRIFPEGQIVTVVDDKIVGCALSIIVNYNDVKNDHTYAQVTGNETFDTHTRKGNILYGIEVFIHPDYRGLRLARRMYEYRKELCEKLNLKAIMFGGRLPNYHKYADRMRPKEYIDKVRQREIFDPVLLFQLSNDFHVRKVMRNYLPNDEESKHFACLLQWDNIYYQEPTEEYISPKTTVRVGLVQWQMRSYKTLDDLFEQVEFFVDSVSGYQSDFVLFPEYFNAPLMARFNDASESQAGVTLVQPVFMGGRIVNGNKLANIGKQVSKYQLSLTEDQVEASVNQYYWQIVALKEKLRTLETLETQLKGIYKDVKAAVDAGLTIRNDLLRVELQQQDIMANRLKVENGLSVTKMLLCQLIGVDKSEFDIAFDDFPSAVSPLDYYVAPETGLENRAESKLLDKSVEAAKLQLRMKRGENLPSVGVGAGYIYHDLMEKDTDFGMIFASVSVPISSWWGGSHAIKREKIKKQQAENTRQDSREMMLVEIEVKWNDLQEAYQQVLLSEKSIESSTENLRLNNDYYKAGTVSLSDLLDAQSLMQQSHDQYAEACTAYQQKLTAYLQATGR